MIPTPYRTKHARYVGGFSEGTFNQWITRGLTRPTIPARGRGNPAEWSLWDIIGLVLTRKLNKVAGMDLNVAADIAEKLCKNWPDFIHLENGFNVAIDLETLKYGDMDDMKSGMVLVVDLERIQKEVESKLGRM